jgi:general secretion pathway protein G|tara:strand:- start:4380 stop:4793 length:414 start_codon:yes stop_codon:yes gene_type:complete
MKKLTNSRNKAFTLIEILVALTIIGVLLTFVAPMVLNRPDQARNLKIQNDFSSIETALNLYRLDKGAFPTKNQGIKILINDENTSIGYLASLPKDPWSNQYRMEFIPNGGIQIRSSGQDGIFDTAGKGDDHFSKVFK